MIDIERLYEDLSKSKFVDVGIAGDSLHFIFKKDKELFGIKVDRNNMTTMEYQEKVAKGKDGEKK